MQKCMLAHEHLKEKKHIDEYKFKRIEPSM